MFTTSKRPEQPVLSAGDKSGGATADAPVTPTLTHYQQLADRVSVLIDEIMTILPKLEVPHPTTTGFVRGHLSVPAPFIMKTIAGVALNESLRNTGKLDVTFGRDTMQLDDAFRPVVDKLFHFAENLKFTLDARYALAAAAALQMYQIIKSFGRDPGGAPMLQLAEDLKEELGRRGPRKQVKPAPQQALLPAPAVEKPAGAVYPEPVQPEAALARKRIVRGKEGSA